MTWRRDSVSSFWAALARRIKVVQDFCGRFLAVRFEYFYRLHAIHEHQIWNASKSSSNLEKIRKSHQ